MLMLYIGVGFLYFVVVGMAIPLNAKKVSTMPFLFGANKNVNQ